jgi:HSP20 family protein
MKLREAAEWICGFRSRTAVRSVCKESVMRSLIPYDPLLEPDVNDWFRGFFKPVRWEGAPAPVMIKMDVTETKNGYLVHAEMPGVRKEDIEVSIEGNQVTVAAEVKREAEKKEGDKVLRSERYFGKVYRSFTLPADLDEGACEAKYDKGVLELKRVAKAATPGKKLAVS